MGSEYLLVALVFAGFLACLMTGYPVAFVLGGVGVAFALFGDLLTALGVETGASTRYVGFVADRMFDAISNYSLVPMSMFVFMGYVLERSGIAERLLNAMRMTLGRAPGGLALSVVALGVVLGASTGIIGASVVLLTTIALPTLLKRGYDAQLSIGTVCATGCLGILIPPSIMLIVLGDQLRLSVGDLFMGAVLPGLLLAGLYAVYIVVIAVLRPGAAPRVTRAEFDAIGTARLVLEIVRALLAPVALVFAVLGSIFFGVASPTEAAGVGAAGACVLAAAAGRFNVDMLKSVCRETGKTTAFLFAIIFGAGCFSVVLRGYGGDHVIESLVRGLPFGPHGVLAVFIAVVFMLGFFLDWMEIVLIIAPLVVPVVAAMGLDPVWVAILMAVCLQTSFLTPPVGMALFYAKAAAPPEITTRVLYSGVAPFVAIQLGAIAIVWYWPQLVLWLPAQAYR